MKLYNWRKIRKIFRPALLLLIIIYIFSCKKYVDIPRSSLLGILETANDCQLLLDNVDVMNSGYPNDGQLSSDDVFLTNTGYVSTNLGQDDRDIYSWVGSAIRGNSDPQWLKPYYTVYYSNLVLEQVDKLRGNGNDKNILDNLRGSALFFRSFAFWQLAQIYAMPYSEINSQLNFGIPLRLNSDINDKTARSTVNETYSKILADLSESLELLPTTSIVPTRPNKCAAYAMLARVYLSMGNYEEALNNSDLALQLNSQLLTYKNLTPSSPFSPQFNKEVIFHAVTTDRGPGVNPSGVGRINPELYSLYEQNDSRKTLFINALQDGSYQFRGNYSGGSTSAKQFVGLAVDEMYLIRAECNARNGKVNEAMSDLNNLLSTRWIANYINKSAENELDALTLILSERRKELIMRGLRWSDLRRLNTDSRFATTIYRNIQGQTHSLQPNDPRYTLLIPNEVITRSNIEQNPR